MRPWPELRGRPVAAAPPVLDGTRRAPPDLRGAVLLLGNFDGLHPGHLALFRKGAALAAGRGVPLAAMQCDPHPRSFFGGEAGFRIATGAVQARLLAGAGAEVIYAPRFDAGFAALAPGDFAARHLACGLGVSAVVAGQGFRFGRGRAGDMAQLAEAGRRHGFSVNPVADVGCAREGRRISSSRIRSAIRAGRIAEAEALLGHPVELALAETGPQGQAGFDPLQILPPDGLWPVLALGPAGQPIGRAALHLSGRHGRLAGAAGQIAALRLLAGAGTQTQEG
ncbi:hypothetical protein [Poseidonocella sp. HB161398]|uniref:hypothetical protein n=1 Tax=Poseidonocella sp. HB161398 TaxID=2320855 RepID=UPI0014867B2A|nr:hypothetical protein [Poseidonocella sp. HB161398]